MIFVTVGTHEQPFNRLLQEIDLLVLNNIIKEKVVIQYGFSDYVPKYCESHQFLSFSQMNSYINKARIVITHGGPASFIQVLQKNKIPVVVPRLKKYNEHINNHQLEFVKLIEQERKNIIPVYNINDLKKVILNYDVLSSKKSTIKSNNKQFNLRFEKIVESLFEDKK